MLALRVRAPALGTAWALVLALVAWSTSHEVREPYMDEIFHVPQAAAYCRGEWNKWDPKLTTPPGLYLISVLTAKAQHAIGLGDGTCSSPPALRAVPLVSLLLLPWLLAAIRLAVLGDKLGSGAGQTIALLEGFSLASLPPLWMLGFLYYTDVSSLVAVLLCYLLALQRRHVQSSLVGVLSLLFRQTNIIWVAFVAWNVLLTDLQEGGANLPPLEGQSVGLFRGLLEMSQSLSRLSGTTWTTAIKHLVTYSPSPLAFGTFLIWNGSIVLGDKSNHQAGLHAMQLPYLALFISFFAWPYLFALGGGIFGPARCAVQAVSSRSRFIALAAIVVCTTVAVRWGTVFHPFLLADNRHYAFYFRRRLLAFPLTRYVLVPFYALSMLIWGSALARARSLPWILGLVGCSALVLVPSPLLEPRYFVVPYLVLRLNLPVQINRGSGENQTARLHTKPPPNSASSLARISVAIEFAWAMVINAVTMYMFLFRPFAWPQEPERRQRFMW